MSEIYVKTADMAKALAMTVQYLNRISRENVVSRPTPQGWPALTVTEQYIVHLRERVKEDKPTIAKERLKLTKAKRETSEFQLREMKLKAEREAAGWGRIEDFEAARRADYRSILSTMLSIASRVSQAMPHLSRADIQKIDDEIRTALEWLADGNDIADDDGEARA